MYPHGVRITAGDQPRAEGRVSDPGLAIAAHEPGNTKRMIEEATKFTLMKFERISIDMGSETVKAGLRTLGVACGFLIIMPLSSAAETSAPAVTMTEPGKAASATAGQAGDEFDRDAAKKALQAAADRAKGCKMPDGPTGTSKVTVTFATSGEVRDASVGSPFAGTKVGTCIVRAFRLTKVPPFRGSPMTVAKSVAIN